MNIEKNISLQPYNTFNIDAKAAHFFALKNIEDLQAILTHDSWHNMPTFILGGGSNILFTQDYSGLVIRNELKGYQLLDENDAHAWIKIASGESWHQFVMHCVEHQYGGIENLSLIPGTVGAAPMQNIGAYGVEICSVFESLEAIELKTGTLKTFNKKDCHFSYRQSIFNNTHKDDYFVTQVTLKLKKKPEFNIHYGAIQDTLKAMHAEPSIRNISNAVIKIRQNKLPDPNKIPNAGSFFKNPLMTKAEFQSLQKKCPNIPHYAAENNHIKIPAAWLIEQCGWKGKTLGRAGVHEHQALVLVNRNHANGADLKELADAIQQSVKDKFGITLMPEVNVI